MAEVEVKKKGWRDAIDWRDIFFVLGGTAIEIGLFMFDARFSIIGGGVLLLFLSLWRI